MIDIQPIFDYNKIDPTTEGGHALQYAISFLEGVVTFISPCLLPMLPVYISYFAGTNQSGRSHVIKNALGFILGFTLVFVSLGALAGYFGQLLDTHRTTVNLFTGCVVILFGLHYIGVFRLPIFKGIRFKHKEHLDFISSLLFGVVFSIGWTPCVGAFLGSALMLAANRASALEGVFMLFMYALGLGIPFFISAMLVDRLKVAFSFVKQHYRIINLICGGLLIIIGVLMSTGLFGYWLALLS